MKPAPHPMRRATRHPRCQPRAPRSVGGYAKDAPQQGDAPTHADRMRALSAASVKRHSSRLQISNIRTLTTICHAASSPIRHALAQEKLTNDIQNPINHYISPHPSTNPAPPDGARARKTRTHPTRGAHATLTNTQYSTTSRYTQTNTSAQKTRYPPHKRGKGRAPNKRTGTAPDTPPTRGRPRRLHNSIPAATRATRRTPPPIRYTRLTRRQAQPRHQTPR